MKRIVIFTLVILLIFNLTACSSIVKIISETTPKIEFNNEYVYNWLLDNGELINGTILSHTINYDNGAYLCLSSTSDKVITVIYSYVPSNGLSICLSMPLFSQSMLYFDCEIVDETITGVKKQCALNKIDFTKNSPIEINDFICFYSDGYYIDHLIYNNGKYYREYYSAQEHAVVQAEIPQTKVAIINSIDDNFALYAQKGVCVMLNSIYADLCPLWSIEMADLGFTKY